MTLALVAGVDTSTQSCKVELYTLEGERVAGASAAHPPVAPPRSEQDPRAWWSAFVEAFRGALDEARVRAGDRGELEVRAIAVGGQCHGLVALDGRGEVIRDAKLWNDTTSTPELEALLDEIGADRMLERVGTLPTAAFTLSKVAWLRAHEPENFAAMRHMLLPHDYLGYRLTGRMATDRSEASGTAYFDAVNNRYLLEHLEIIDGGKDWAAMLPEVLPPEGVTGVVTPQAAAELGILPGATVTAGGGDQHVSALGLGISEGELVFSLGTSGVVFTTTDQPVRDRSGAVDCVANLTGGFLPLSSTLNAAKTTDTFARLMGVDHDGLSALALAAGDDGPVLAAYLDGERTPNRPDATGLLADLTTSTSREEIARAAYEGVVFGLVFGMRQMERVGVPVGGAVTVIGGGSRSPAYTQLIADAVGRPVQTVDVPEAVTRGAAVQAAAVLTGTTVAEKAAAWRPPGRVVAEPRPGAHAARYERYLEVASCTELDRSRSR
ncbi:xylulokinase [Leucobacter sp. CSA1]|uniref:Xylulose kinase n=1 Tax=Leucobacter chromiisoli TaxID=2796471 RepID=A0A934Q5V9_9MICO|nr:xylulokinase [Leucobacter chromiisoli]MBK0417447.1 xylulokinase [Leucobacter chromiisoli]